MRTGKVMSLGVGETLKLILILRITILLTQVEEGQSYELRNKKLSSSSRWVNNPNFGPRRPPHPSPQPSYEGYGNSEPPAPPATSREGHWAQGSNVNRKSESRVSDRKVIEVKRSFGVGEPQALLPPTTPHHNKGSLSQFPHNSNLANEWDWDSRGYDISVSYSMGTKKGRAHPPQLLPPTSETLGKGGWRRGQVVDEKQVPSGRSNGGRVIGKGRRTREARLRHPHSLQLESVEEVKGCRISSHGHLSRRPRTVDSGSGSRVKGSSGSRLSGGGGGGRRGRRRGGGVRRGGGKCGGKGREDGGRRSWGSAPSPLPSTPPSSAPHPDALAPPPHLQPKAETLDDAPKQPNPRADPSGLPSHLAPLSPHPAPKSSRLPPLHSRNTQSHLNQQQLRPHQTLTTHKVNEVRGDRKRRAAQPFNPNQNNWLWEAKPQGLNYWYGNARGDAGRHLSNSNVPKGPSGQDRFVDGRNQNLNQKFPNFPTFANKFGLSTVRVSTGLVMFPTEGRPNPTIRTPSPSDQRNRWVPLMVTSPSPSPSYFSTFPAPVYNFVSQPSKSLVPLATYGSKEEQNSLNYLHNFVEREKVLKESGGAQRPLGSTFHPITPSRPKGSQKTKYYYAVKNEAEYEDSDELCDDECHKPKTPTLTLNETYEPDSYDETLRIRIPKPKKLKKGQTYKFIIETRR